MQHRIVQQAALIWSLVQEGGYIYVCGSQTMRDDVRFSFVKVFETCGALTEQDAESYMAQLETEHRYRPDVWG